MAQNINGTFISEKTNKIRWRPDTLNYSRSFVTGSWDNTENNVKLWEFHENEDDLEFYPFLVKSYPFDGDVTEMKFVNPDFFLTSSSYGGVSLLKIFNDVSEDTQILEEQVWDNLFTFKTGEASSCTGFDSYDNDVIAVGENGQISMLNTKSKEPVHTINEASSCSLNAVAFLKYNEILTGDSRGQMKIWDFRISEKQTSLAFMLSSEQIAATCLALHPTQKHMVVAGDEGGSLSVWDLRQHSYPINLLTAHSESISELKFHPDHPDQLFSCSHSGEVWHWVTNNTTKSSDFFNTDNLESNPWFSPESIRNKLEVYVPMPKLHKPINTVDLDRNRLLCGCDNEAIYFISNINVY